MLLEGGQRFAPYFIVSNVIATPGTSVGQKIICSANSQLLYSTASFVTLAFDIVVDQL